MIGFVNLANSFVATIAQPFSVAIVRRRISLGGAADFIQIHKSSAHRPFSRGFTLLELVIVFGILALLAGVILSSFSGFRNSKVLDTAVEDVLTAFSQARGDTLSSKDGYQYGVHLEADQVIIYRGTTYSGSDPNNQAVALDGALEIVSDTLVVGSDVLFERLTGKTAQSGTFVICVKNDTAKVRTITVNGTGLASVN